MWGKKIRKIVDLSVAGVLLLTGLGLAGGQILPSYIDYRKKSDAFDAQQKALYDSMRDDQGHVPSIIKAVDPTETTVGYTAGKKCIECGEIYDGHEEIPVINEQNYTKNITSNGSSVTVTWRLKNSYAQTLGTLSYSKVYTKGFITLNGVSYFESDFNAAFPGVEMSYDEEASTITLNVTKKSGYTFNNTYLEVLSDCTYLVVKGYPLTFISDGGKDGIGMDSNKGILVVDNELEVHQTNYVNNTNGKSGIVANQIIVNKKGVLRVNNFTYGFYVPGSFQIDGELEASGTTSAIYNLSGGVVNVGEDRSVYVKEVLQTVANNKLSFGACGKHLAICDSTSTIKSFITFKLSKAITKPTTSTSGSASFVCVGCGTTTTVLKLPVLNEQNYDVEVTPNFIRYTYVLSIHADPIVIEIAR